MNQDKIRKIIERLQEETAQEPEYIGEVNIANVMLWMKEKAYEETTIRRVAKELRHLKRNCNISSPKETRLFIANKTCSNARKENLAESYNYLIQSLNLLGSHSLNDETKRRAPNEQLLEL